MDSIITSPLHDNLSLRSWVGFILGVGMIWAGISGGLNALRRGSRKSLPKENVLTPEPAIEQTEDWQLLCARADRVVHEILSQLPAEIAPEARLVPCLFKPRADHEFPGYRTLGHYNNFIPGRISDHKGPIFLYLKSIEESCAEKDEDFDEQVKRTYLHELGHHFGWDEIDLARHGLPSGRPPGK